MPLLPQRPVIAGRETSRHGVAVPTGLNEPPTPGSGRFGRMFDFDPRTHRDAPADDAIEQLAQLLIRRAGGSGFNGRIPAGYTYLGQFIDHDVTFDPSSALGREVDPAEVENFRTPRLDLDSLYGSGPQVQSFLYDWNRRSNGVKLLVGRNRQDDSQPPREPLAREDLPRNRAGRAIVGDSRNDENLIIVQLHLLFIKFHNKVVDQLAPDGVRSDDATDVLEAAQQLVRWHYQWIVVHEFLPKIVGQDIVDDVLHPAEANGPPTVDAKFFILRPGERPYMPVEFSAAAFRFGHSMVRDTYRLNEEPGAPIFLLAGEAAERHLTGLRRLPKSLVIDWDRFFPTPELMEDTPATANVRMDSLRIDTSLASRLGRVPPNGRALARLNLARGHRVQMPPASIVTEALQRKVETRVLSPDELGLEGIHDTAAAAILGNQTPLWYYILREAEVLGDGGQHLGPAGGRIVTEVLLGLLEGDAESYLSKQPDWTPTLGKDGDFTMRDLIEFVGAEAV